LIDLFVEAVVADKLVDMDGLMAKDKSSDRWRTDMRNVDIGAAR
jgi:hypothetical protein